MTKRNEKKESAKKSAKNAPNTVRGRLRAKVGAGKLTQKTAKRAVKRAVKRKTLTAKSTKRSRTSAPGLVLVQAPDWQAFYAVNGAVLRSLGDLARELETMSESEYLHHKDHFVSWVREVLGDGLCADDLSKIMTRNKAKKVVHTHLKRYDLRIYS
jgi:hypothetical protein